MFNSVHMPVWMFWLACFGMFIAGLAIRDAFAPRRKGEKNDSSN